jgi:tryptophan synthase alpha chain
MSTRLTTAFARATPLLSMYTTMGYPRAEDTVAICEEFARGGAGMIELGIPYSDPVADGPVLQRVNAAALANGMTMSKGFALLREIRPKIEIPIVLMGYFNPVLQYGVERFCEECRLGGADGVILPDLPMEVYRKRYQRIFEDAGVSFVFLVTPDTSDDRIREIDELSTSFIYVVSAQAVTGTSLSIDDSKRRYFEHLASLHLRHPLVAGFGIDSRTTFLAATRWCAGAIIASAYLRELERAKDVREVTRSFLNRILGEVTE